MIFLLSPSSRNVLTVHPLAGKHIHGTARACPLPTVGHLKGGRSQWAPPCQRSLLLQYHSFIPVFLYQFLANVDLQLA